MLLGSIIKKTKDYLLSDKIVNSNNNDDDNNNNNSNNKNANNNTNDVIKINISNTPINSTVNHSFECDFTVNTFSIDNKTTNHDRLKNYVNFIEMITSDDCSNNTILISTIELFIHYNIDFKRRHQDLCNLYEINQNNGEDILLDDQQYNELFICSILKDYEKNIKLINKFTFHTMLSYYYSRTTLPSTLDNFIPLVILQDLNQQKDIINFIENNPLTRENAFSEYYKLDNELSNFLETIFTLNEFHNNRDKNFVLVILRIDKGHFDSILDKLEDILLIKNNYLLTWEKISKLSYENNQLLHIFYVLKDKDYENCYDLEGNIVNKV